MDPDQTLADLRAAQDDASRASGRWDDQQIAAWHAANERIADCAGYLDEWLSKGGALPKAWQR